MKIGYIGFGAIGATIGAQMIDKDIPITVIVDESRKDRYKKEGTLVNGKHYHFDVLTPKMPHEAFDVVFVSTKYNQLAEASAQIKPFVDDQTAIISLLNGIDSEDILAETFPKSQIIHAFVVAIDALRIGNEITYLNKGKIVLGAGFPEAGPMVSKITKALDLGGVDYEVKEGILKELWWKFLVNVGANQVSAVLKAQYGLFQENEYAQSLMHEAMREVIAISRAVGTNLDESSIQTFTDILMTLGKEKKTSMLQDVEAKRITEVDMLAGKVIAMGKQYGIPVPINEVLFKMIKAMEANY